MFQVSVLHRDICEFSMSQCNNPDDVSLFIIKMKMKKKAQ